MKRILSLLISLTILLSLVGCATDISGNYVLTSSTSTSDELNGLSSYLAYYQLFGMTVNMKLYKDGTGKITATVEEIPIEYNKDEKTMTITIGSMIWHATYTYKEGTLTIKCGPQIIDFEKQSGD